MVWERQDLAISPSYYSTLHQRVLEENLKTFCQKVQADVEVS